MFATTAGKGVLQSVEALIALDTFTDANATTLASHKMDRGRGWTVSSGTWTISSNALSQSTTPGSRLLVWTETNQLDVTVQCDFTLPTLDATHLCAPILMLRLVDSTNYWMVYINSDGAGAGTDQLILAEVNAGVDTNRATFNGTFSSGTTYAIKVVADGSTITGFVDGTQRVTYASAAGPAGTKCGIGEYRDASYVNAPTYDNFKVFGKRMPV